MKLFDDKFDCGLILYTRRVVVCRWQLATCWIDALFNT